MPELSGNMGGCLRFISNLGQGTIFGIETPFQLMSNLARDQAAGGAVARCVSKKVSIVLVGDYAEVAQVISGHVAEAWTSRHTLVPW
ncbi:hypothetical protein [Xanthomonas citri]|uniref:hypothetical protein n=1 Tax=Xanthomonas citri TaxID=346 RepID=UPI00103AC1DB|nr:hypothetical protein [Xanthomonas citri]